MGPPPPTLLSALRDRIRAKHYSPRTEAAYVAWVRRYIGYHGRRHPRDLDVRGVRDFLTHLARDGQVSASTQNQALAALLFLYGEVLGITIAAPTDHLQARRPTRLPSVLTRAEVTRVLERMRGPTRLMASLLYGSGLRLMECCRLRVKDLDLTRGEITVREGKGQKDRVTMLPRSLIAPLEEQMRRGQARHVA
ncbi:MAG: phage integrase N-terminal SAM-like domain-containing protein, partial [Gemmatimonadota bacterium]